MGLGTKVMKLPNGDIETMYPISRLAEEMGRGTPTIRKWEIGGIIPKAIFRDKNGRRYYTEEQIQTILDVAQKCNVRQGYSICNTGFPKRVFEAWDSINAKYGMEKEYEGEDSYE